MKQPFLFVLLLLIGAVCQAQAPGDKRSVQDSLENILQQATNDSMKVRANLALSASWVTKDTLKARQYLQQAQVLIKKQDHFLQALHLYHAALTLPTARQDEQQANFMKADSLLLPFTHQEAHQYRAMAWYQYGRIQQRKDDPKAFADILVNKAIPLAEKSGDRTLVGKDYLALSLVFKNTGQHEKAETYILKAIDAFKHKSVASHELITAYLTLAENSSLSAQNPKARLALDSTLLLLPEYPESEYYIDFYAAEGMYYTVESQFKPGQLKLALASLEKGVEMARRLKLRYEEQRLVMQQFYAHYNDKNYEKAKSTLDYLMQQPEIMGLATNRLQLFYGMAATCEGLQQMGPAYQWMKRYSELSDSVQQSQLKNDVHALEIKYQNAEKQKEIDALKAKTVQDALTAKNSRLVNSLLAAGVVLLLVILLFAFITYRNKKKLHEQKELAYRQQLTEIEQRQQIQFSQAVLQGEEQERKRLAQDLHDGLGGMLAGAKINLSTQIKDTYSQNQRAELEKITMQLDHSVTELRRIAHNMMPVNLLKFGLETALKDLCESLMNGHTKIDFQALNISGTLREEAQIHIYRIVQELLSNAIRHGHASHIMLQCSQNGNIFYITQEDNGRGFDMAAAAQMKGIGLSNIKNRVGFLRGKIDIDSAVNEGTTVNIELHVEE